MFHRQFTVDAFVGAGCFDCAVCGAVASFFSAAAAVATTDTAAVIIDFVARAVTEAARL